MKGIKTCILLKSALLFTMIFLLGDNNVTSSILNEIKTTYTNRSSKWLPLIVIVGNEPCNSTDSHEIGTCFTMTQCSRSNGLPKGNCASGFGVCCVFVRSCFDTISKNNTYFRSIGFPDHFKPNDYQVCNTKIIKPQKDICQVLLTFHDMELEKGDKNGQCLVDNIKLFGMGMTNQNAPHLCGPLSKQHMYLEFGNSNQLTVSISTDGAQVSSTGRKWNVQVAFIRCNDPFRAPSGCLQYFTKSSGTVKILGYPESPHLAGLQYTICVRKEVAAESIFWFPCRDVPFEKTFHLQGPSILTSGFSLRWISCYGDYITIMSDRPSTAVQNLPQDRYCGNRLTALPPFYVNTKATPYIIVVRTDLIEVDVERDNTGFCLEWHQVIWKVTNAAQGMPPPDIFPPPASP